MSARFFRGILAAVVMLVVGASLASASTITYTSAEIFGPPAPYEQAPLWSQNVSLPRFNVNGDGVDSPVLPPPTLGYIYVLDKVQVTLDWHTTGLVHVDNSDYNATHGFTEATSSVPLTVTGPSALTVNVTATAGPIDSASSTATDTYNPIPYPGVDGPGVPGADVPMALCAFFSPPGHCLALINAFSNYGGLVASGSASSSPSGLALYEGVGNATINFTATAGYGSYKGKGDDHLSFGGSVTAGGIVSIEYTYHEESNVPEPETLFLVGSALIGVSVMFQRKRKRARS